MPRFTRRRSQVQWVHFIIERNISQTLKCSVFQIPSFITSPSGPLPVRFNRPVTFLGSKATGGYYTSVDPGAALSIPWVGAGFVPYGGTGALVPPSLTQSPKSYPMVAIGNITSGSATEVFGSLHWDCRSKRRIEAGDAIACYGQTVSTAGTNPSPVPSSMKLVITGAMLFKVD